MKRPFDKLRVPVLATLLLGGCTTGQSNGTPPITTGGGGGSGSFVLQLSVGTVNFSGTASGLVVLETFRDSSGFTAIPITTALLHGPQNFVAPHGSKDPGSGAHGTIPIGSASNQFIVGGAGATTTLSGADGWGVGPPSCSCPGVNFYPFQPQFADVITGLVFPGGAQPMYGGPPAYPPTVLSPSALSPLVSIPSGWAQGFYLIGLSHAPPSGRYSIEVWYAQNGVATTKSAAASLHPKQLPFLTKPHVRSDGKGGLVITQSVPPGVKQLMLNVIDAYVPPAKMGAGSCPTGLGFATLIFTQSGTKRIPDNIGNYGQGGAPTFCKGDEIEVQAFGFDYDDFDLGPPRNTQQRPALPAQADMTISYPTVVFE